MFSSLSLNLMHHLTGFMLEPVVWALLFFVALAVFETGIAFGERFRGIKKLLATKDQQRVIRAGRRRIERADFITRLAPMLGLMGTLIPLGPGLAALGDGKLRILTTAMTVAFDTTVIGLLAGMVGFVLGRLRRRWYDAAIETLQQNTAEAGNG